MALASSAPHGAVFKFGSDIGFAGGYLRQQVDFFAQELSDVIGRGDDTWSKAIVFSGAVALGGSVLPPNIHTNPQVARRVKAAYGQALIQQELTRCFTGSRSVISELAFPLLTNEDFEHGDGVVALTPETEEVLRTGIAVENSLTIINTNDSMGTELEPPYNSNDIVAALVANAINARELFLFTDVGGVYRNYGTEQASLIGRASIEDDWDMLMNVCVDVTSQSGTGGMFSKIQAGRYFLQHNNVENTKLVYIAQLLPKDAIDGARSSGTFLKWAS